MLNRSASLAMSTSVLKALPGKLDIKRHSPSILYVFTFLLGYNTSLILGLINPFVPNEMSISYQLDQSISAVLMFVTCIQILIEHCVCKKWRP